MSVKNRVEAIAKNIEGKVQEVVGKITGDTKNRVEGQIKQEEAALRRTKEDIKDRVKNMIDRA